MLAQPLAEELERHVECCLSCQQHLQALDAPDALVQAARTAAAKPKVKASAAAEHLMERFTKLSNVTGVVGTLEPNQSTQDTDLDIARVLAPSQNPDEIGRLGPYRILGILGQGGMGVVFRAEDAHLRRQIALKVIKPQLASNALARERFLREARSAAAIEHDNIVPLFHVGEDRGFPYLAFPLLKGENLESLLQREGKLPLAEVLRIGGEIARGLAAAHARGVIHRDIKPANIWLEGEQRRVKLLDFGLARALTEAQDGDSSSSNAPTASHLTQWGAAHGTPAYMPPEQARGDTVDARADLFSLGAVLYRMATGRVAFAGTSVSTLLELVQRESPAPPRSLNRRIPTQLSALIEQLLSKDPGQRPQSAAVVSDVLAGMSRGRVLWKRAAVLLAPLLVAVVVYVAVFSPLAAKHTASEQANGLGGPPLVASTQIPPTPRPNGRLLFQDRFDTPAPLTDPVANSDFLSFDNVEGRGRLRTKYIGVRGVVYSKQQAKDFAAEYDFQVANPNTTSKYGFFFRSDIEPQGLPNYYVLFIHPLKETASFHCWQRDWTFARDFKLPAECVDVKGTSSVRLEACGPEFRFFINGGFVGEVIDHKIGRAGIFGFFVSASEAVENTAYFSNLRIYDLTDVESKNESSLSRWRIQPTDGLAQLIPRTWTDSHASPSRAITSVLGNTHPKLRTPR
jgi:serine/threonine protein kinase